ncbi:C13 family peptidase [Aestuariirhabdus sp. LZHN29]|uniref:C13 family peptidase n=1 Tax=Aestuariirhabdus sp. LZHN29 TaxID=3417462 RepID=UPI003CFB9770
MRSGVRGMVANLKAGGRLLSWRSLRAGQLAISFDQLVALIALDLLLQVAGDWLQAPPLAQFNPWSLLYSAGGWVLIGLAAWLVTHLLRRRNLLLPLLVGLFALLPLLHLLQWLAYAIQGTALAFEALPLLVGVVLLWGLWIGPLRLLRLFGVGPWRGALASLLLLLLWMPVAATYSSYAGFWVEAYDDERWQEDEMATPYAPLDGEALLIAQHQQLGEALGRVEPQRPGVTDLYFVAFAPYANQDVFLSEVQIIRDLMERRFDAAGRALTLVNHRDTFLLQPLATVTNLQLSLQALGEVMDPEEDLLVLYLTSHGSKDHRLAAEFGDLPLTELTPPRLARMLEQAGIRWQVVLISACYGGGYLPELADDSRFVAAAAAADRTSFGCSNDHDMTYFGNALFREQLSQRFSMIDAMRQAQRSILDRERQEALEPSLPGFRVGEAMAIKWQTFSDRLSMLACDKRVSAEGATNQGAALYEGHHGQCSGIPNSSEER